MRVCTVLKRVKTTCTRNLLLNLTQLFRILLVLISQQITSITVSQVFETLADINPIY